MISSDFRGMEPGLKDTVPLRQHDTTSRVFVGREDQAALLDKALGQPGWQGAVVVGQGGIGKTSLVQDLIARVPTLTATRYLRGTILTADTPYGILGLLMGRAQTMALQSLSLNGVVQRLLRNLCIPEPQVIPVVVVDNAEYADSWSAMALAELVRTRTIKLVVVCRRINGIPAEFSKLWRAGHLLRIDMPPMCASDVRALICNEVAGPCSLAAATTLWAQSAGNPLFLRALLKRGLAEGSLTCVDGIWVCRNQQTEDATTRVLGPLKRLMNADCGNVELLELVSVVGKLSAASILRHYSSSDLDELLEYGDLQYVGSGKSDVAVTHPMLARVMPLSVSQEQSQEWISTYKENNSTEGTHGNAQRRPSERAGEYGRMNHSVLDFARDRAEDAHTPNRADGDTPKGMGSWQLLAEMVERVGLMGLPADHIQHCSLEQAQWAARYAEKLALDGKQDDASFLSQALTERLGIASSITPFPRTVEIPAGLAMPLMRTYTIAGEWQCLEELLAACLNRGIGATLAQCIEFELTHGVIRAYQGHQEIAAPLLRQGIAQLREVSLKGWGTVAEIAGRTSVAGSHHDPASLGDTSAECTGVEAAQLRRMFEVVVRERELPGLMITLAQCLLVKMIAGDHVGAIVDDPVMEKICLMNRRDEQPAQRMLILAEQADGTTTDICEELLMVASAHEGSMAEVLSLYAKGLLTRDSTVLVQTVDRACSMNFQALSAKAAGSALKHANPSSIRSVRRQLQRLVNLPADLTESADALNAVLTDREEAVGLLAANGASNKEIAHKLGVSVRTVEGHLYQVYAKLQVASRIELLPLLPKGLA